MKYEFSQAPRVLFGRTGSAVMALLLLILSGCGQQYEQASAPDDEAMKRALVEKKTADQAAQQYFLPKYYFDPKNDATPVPNYFRGMDTVVVLPTEIQKDSKQEINQLNTPVFQLLDKHPPEFVFADAVQSNNEILGRNTWMAWCGGNEGFWDWLATDSLGFIDLLKLIDSRQRTHRFQDGGLINEPGMAQNGTPDEFGLWLDTPNDADTVVWRRKYLQSTFAAINERKHESQRGLFDEPSSYRGNSADSYSTPGKDYGSLGSANHEQKLKELTDEAAEYPPPGIYGISSGVVGLRLFPNPKFDAEARKKWDAKRYYTDEDYAADPKLVRPYRVGVACAYCHASFHPLNPPRDVTNPSWENVSGNIGAQYLRIRVAFGNLLKPDNYIYHLLDSQPPGTIDTSLIASDNINNPNTMNSVFALPQRALLSFRNPQENISIASGSLPSIWGSPDASISSVGPDIVPPFYQRLFQAQGLTGDLKKSNSHPLRSVPRILLDGSDSVGAYAALARVYLNIGMYWEQWIRIHRPVVGFKKQSPFTISDCEHHSVYWHATKLRVPALRDYFLKATPPMPLVAAAVGKREADRSNEIIRKGTPEKSAGAQENFAKKISEAIVSHVDQKKLKRGREVFANNCIVCHSSIQPESSDVTLGVVPVPEQTVEQKQKFDELVKRRIDSRAEVAKLNEFWEHDPGQWLRDEDYLTWAEHAVECQDFWRFNYLSTDYRIPITLVQTNAGRAMATNALDGAMWDDFASESYQHLPSVGAIDFFNPYLGKEGGVDQFTPRHKVGSGVPSAGGGPGYYRVPTLISIWATAPYLHNNSLGKFTNNPTIEGRMRAFDDGIRKLLWPAKRLESSSYNEATAERLKKDHGLIWRTPRETFLTISGRRVPTLLAAEVPALMQISEQYPWLGDIRPIWLPSAILLLASFLMLVVDSAQSRRKIGWSVVALAGVGFLVWFLHTRCGWFVWLEMIRPLWLPSVLLLVTGLVILSLDCARTLRTVAIAALVVAVMGLILSWLDVDWKWLEALRQVGPIGWLSNLLALGGLFLLATHSRWRQLIAYVALVFAVFGFIVYAHDSNLEAYKWSEAIGPVWIYGYLLVSAAIVLLVPDVRELSRYVGYATLVLSMSLGTGLYYLNGQLADVRIGPIPKGTPVNLLANLNPEADPKELAQAIKITLSTFAEIESKHLDDATSQKLLHERVAPALLKVNKCPDFVMDHGHDFEWFQGMKDEDKECLIELLKTF